MINECPNCGAPLKKIDDAHSYCRQCDDAFKIVGHRRVLANAKVDDIMRQNKELAEKLEAIEKERDEIIDPEKSERVRKFINWILGDE